MEKPPAREKALLRNWISTKRGWGGGGGEPVNKAFCSIELGFQILSDVLCNCHFSAVQEFKTRKSVINP